MSIPNFSFDKNKEISKKFIERGYLDFKSAFDYVWRLPYGRTKNRAEFLQVLEENHGTCSTKHALLAKVAEENNHPIKLTLGIYKMDGENTFGIGEVLDKHDLEYVPEAHCYLTFENSKFDITRFSESPEIEITEFMHEEFIKPEQIDNYKVDLHKEFLRIWLKETNIGEKYSFDKIWKIREECILAIENSKYERRTISFNK